MLGGAVKNVSYSVFCIITKKDKIKKKPGVNRRSFPALAAITRSETTNGLQMRPGRTLPLAELDDPPRDLVERPEHALEFVHDTRERVRELDDVRIALQLVREIADQPSELAAIVQTDLLIDQVRLDRATLPPPYFFRIRRTPLDLEHASDSEKHYESP